MAKKLSVNKNLKLLFNDNSVDLVVDQRHTGYNEDLDQYYIRLKLSTLKQLKERLSKMSNENFKNIDS